MTPAADTLTDVVLDEMRTLAAEPGAPAVRALQIGAGTDGRTAALLDRLDALAVPVEEYRCTDADDAGLTRLRAAGTDRGYLRLDRLSPERPLDGQGVAPGSYDLLIVPYGLAAAEHHRALRIVKAALARDALLVLQDGMLSAEVLSAEGFTDVEVLGDGDGRVLVGRSDGLVRRDTPLEAGSLEVGQPVVDQSVVGQSVVGQSVVGQSVVGQSVVGQSVVGQPVVGPRAVTARTAEHARSVRQTVIATLADALGLTAGQVEPDVPFADFGLNSVSGVRFLHSLNEALGTRLESTVIFDHSSAERLATHILTEGLVTVPAPDPTPTPTPTRADADADDAADDDADARAGRRQRSRIPYAKRNGRDRGHRNERPVRAL